MKEYFSHDYNARNDTKLVKVFMKYQLKGVGAYWCIIEMLYEEGGYLNKTEFDRIAFELRIDVEIIKSIFEDFELFDFDDNRYYSNTALERLGKRSEKSETAKKAIQKRWDRIKISNGTKEITKDKSQLYLIYCYNNDEEFLKVGITETTISRRYSGKLPYKYKIVAQVFDDKYIELETIIYRDNKEFKINPIITFGGSNECYDFKILDSLLNQIKSNSYDYYINDVVLNDLINRNTSVLRRNTSKVKESKVKESKDIYKKFAHLKITKEENKKLIEYGYDQKQIDSIYLKIENFRQNTKYKSLYLTSLDWLKREFPEKENTSHQLDTSKLK